MTLGKKTLFSLLLGLDLLTNILVLTNVNYLCITTLTAICTYILLPGYLISLIMRIKKITLWENLVFNIGFSVIFLELGGLLLNILLPVLSINDPLSFQNIVIGFNTYLLILFAVAWMRSGEIVIQLPGQSYSTAKSGFIKHAGPDQVVQPDLVKANHRVLEDTDTAVMPKPSISSGLIGTNNRVLEDAETVAFLPTQSAKHPRIAKVLYTVPVFFPILAALGAIILNNGGSGILTLILLGAIAIYTVLLMLWRNKITINIYPYAIFFIGLALLFTTSLRSWYISGHDIQREFFVFELTNTHHIWSMALLQDPYMACLSITILPTVLTNLLSIQDIYIYKVIFQILFATSPVVVFFIIKNYTSPILAYISAFFYMSFPTFFNDMAMLNRQEIGFIFFGLMLYTMLLPELSIPVRRILFLIFGFGVIISHYSTNYVTLALVASVYVLTRILTLPFVRNALVWLSQKTRIKTNRTFPTKPFLNIAVVLLLFAMTYVWNNLYTNSGDHAGSVLTEVIQSMFIKSNDSTAGEISYSIFSPHPKLTTQQEIQQAIQGDKQADGTANQGNANSPYYSQSIIDKYPDYAIPQEQLAPTPLGNWLTSLHIPVFDIQAESRSLSADFMQIFVFVGLLVIFFLKNKKTIDLQYLLLCFSAIFLLVLEIVLPNISVEYGLLRMFQQFLFLLSLPIVLGLYSILFFAKEQKRILFTGIVAIIFFLNLTGFIAHLTGDYYPQMTLDNGGLYYDAYYVHKSDVLAMEWLSKNDVSDAPIDADLSATSKLLSYADINAMDEMYPALIRRDAYVFQNASTHRVVVLEEDILILNSVRPFLDDNKNLIYSNGKDAIYK